MIVTHFAAAVLAAAVGTAEGVDGSGADSPRVNLEMKADIASNL